TFIDLEHYIIPDEITFGGMVVGFLFSLLVPQLQFNVPGFHRSRSFVEAMELSLMGMACGAAVVYGILRVGKWLFGRQKLILAAGTRIYFTETVLKLPEEEIPYGELFYRPGDAVVFDGTRIELVDRCYVSAPVRLEVDKLLIGGETINPENVHHMEAATDKIIL